jgi:hypothetical protein
MELKRKTYLSSLVLGVALSCIAMQAAPVKKPSELTLPASSFERTGIVPATFKFDHAHTGKGMLHLLWTDSVGRVVLDETQPVTLTDEDSFQFPVDMTHAVAFANTLKATFTLDETTPKGPNHVDEQATTEFISSPPRNHWDDYIIIMYQQYPAAIVSRLRLLGVNGGVYVGRNTTPPDFLIDNNIRWNLENIATDFYAEYHRWRLDRPVGWSATQAQALYDKDPSSKEALKRHPSFWDSYWRNKIHDRVMDVVRRNEAYRPLFYGLSDESGIEELGQQWDFDFSDQSLVPMRRWLQQRYGSLQSLNDAWASSFTDWNLVTPPTTNEAMQRKDDNYTAWADFKEWMDISYADALRMGTDAAHEVDPDAYVAIEGAQKPGWGGYDYSRLVHAVSAMEPYDIGACVKIAHSLNPDMPLLSTTFASGNWERQRVWHELLQGERGLILWDSEQRYILADGSKGKDGIEAEPYYNELRDGVGALIINSKGHDDGIAVHYSQASMRTQWMLERRADGPEWMKRGAMYERSENQFMRLRESWGHAIEDQGLQYRYVSYTQVEHGDLLSHGYKVLILPNSSSLSQAEADNMRTFVRDGGVLISDGIPGTFDDHSRKLPQSRLADLFPSASTAPMTVTPYGKGKAIVVNMDTVAYLQNRIAGKEAHTFSEMTKLFAAAGVKPEIRVVDQAGKPIVGVNVRIFQNGGVRLLTLLSNPQMRVNELGPADFKSNDRFEKLPTAFVHLPYPMYVRDPRKHKDLGLQSTLQVSVDPYDPEIFSLSDRPLPALSVALPDTAQAGAEVSLVLNTSSTSAATQIYHVDVLDPSGKRNLNYSGNVIAPGDAAVKLIPFAENDAKGKWTVRAEDMLTGQTETREITLK